MTGDPWGRDEPPAVTEADLEPLPGTMREIVEAFERGDRIPVAPSARTDRPGARDLPEVLGPDVARAHRAGGEDALPPGSEGGWGAVGPGRDDVTYGATDPRGTRGSAAAVGWDGIPGGARSD